MATQGIVSVMKYGRVIFKAVAGCSGDNAEKLAKAIREEHPETTKAVYGLAIKCSFGCNDCLVVMGVDLFTFCPPDELSPAYWSRFDNPTWNPRWDLGTVEYCETVEMDVPVPPGEREE